MGEKLCTSTDNQNVFKVYKENWDNYNWATIFKKYTKVYKGTRDLFFKFLLQRRQLDKGGRV